MYRPTFEERLEMLKSSIRTADHSEKRCWEQYKATPSEDVEIKEEWRQKAYRARTKADALRYAYRLMRF